MCVNSLLPLRMVAKDFKDSACFSHSRDGAVSVSDEEPMHLSETAPWTSVDFLDVDPFFQSLNMSGSRGCVFKNSHGETLGIYCETY